jgi:hypothetical protein
VHWFGGITSWLRRFRASEKHWSNQVLIEGSAIGIELVHRPEDNHEYVPDHLLM